MENMKNSHVAVVVGENKIVVGNRVYQPGSKVVLPVETAKQLGAVVRPAARNPVPSRDRMVHDEGIKER